MGSPVTQQNTSIRFRSFDDPWVTPPTGETDVGSPVHVTKHVFDSGQSTIHRGTPLTGVSVLASPVGHSRESHGSLWGCALQGVSR